MECFCVKSKPITCKIVLLDEQELLHEIQDNCSGQILLDTVIKHLNLLETAYFGLRYLDSDRQTHWLDPSKKLGKQLKGVGDSVTFYFGVKFYAADPCKLLEEITRYQFFLQVKQDILQSRLPVSFELAAELGAYVVQSELGDYDSRRHLPTYISEFRLLTNQSVELESKICDLHKTLVGQLPSVAELNYLDKVKWLDMYGVDLHPVLGEDNVEYFLGLTPSGIVVLRNKNTVGNYYWPRISKIYFKGRYFMLRVTDKNNDESTYGFETPSKSACKHLWKCCIEHHAFFRLVQVSPTSQDIFALSSRFRYSGRTEKQAVRDAQAQIKVRTPPSFLRVSSRRYQRRNDVTDGASNQEPLVKPSADASTDAKYVSIPQQPQPTHLLEQSKTTYTSLFTPTPSAAVAPVKQPDSPRSTRSAPWTQPHSRGLYNSSLPPSPRSVRSAGPRYRSSSVDSQSSNESRSCKRKKHPSRLNSDNESELSKSSGRSHRKHRRHRSRNRRDSGSEADGQHSHRRKSLSRTRRSGSESHYELVDSESQWRAVQRKQQIAEQQNSNIQRANVVRNNRRTEIEQVPAVAVSNEGASTAGTIGRARKSRPKPSTTTAENKWLTEELRKHLEFKLVDTTGMSDSQLKEIPYTVVQTNHAKQHKIKSPLRSELPQIRDIANRHNDRNESPPPPYTPHGMETRRKLSKFEPSASEAAGSFSNNNYGNYNDNGLPRIHHEHTDSGLGGEHDNYNSERNASSRLSASLADRNKNSHMPPSASATSSEQGAGQQAGGGDADGCSLSSTSSTANMAAQVKRNAEMSTEL